MGSSEKQLGMSDKEKDKEKGKKGKGGGDNKKKAKVPSGITAASRNNPDGGGTKKGEVSVLDEAAMENAYNICHNVQDLLYFRGFFWEGDKDKKKGKKGKGKKK